MGDTAIVIGVGYAAAVVLAVVVTILIWASTRRRGPVDAHRMAENEKRWLLVVIAFLLALLLATIWFTPYGRTSGSGRQIVHVSAQQFFWRLDKTRVRAHEPVEFVTRATDVNHGFGIYKGTKLVAQVQVIPDRDQKLVHTFSEPGTYTVLCLEFCGVNHHAMTTSFEVTP